MRLAWFRPADSTTGDTALLIRAARARHDIDVIDAAHAHEFVWKQARDPVDLCVYELDGTPAHQFAAAYAVHYPGLLLLRRVSRHDRPIRASRLVVVAHSGTETAVQDDYPDVQVRSLVPGVEPASGAPPIVDAVSWPLDGAPFTDALAAFGAGAAVIVPECLATSGWPALDPQTWTRRGALEGRDPICVSIDPRDEAHSRRLARRRLEADEALRARLGAAAQAWWREHATPAAAAARLEQLLEEARSLAAPAFAAEDGTSRAREILGEFAPGPHASHSYASDVVSRVSSTGMPMEKW